MNWIPWSPGDCELLKIWIEDYPGIRVHHALGNPSLNKLFPSRQPRAIYKKWLPMRRALFPKKPFSEKSAFIVTPEMKRLAITQAFPDTPLLPSGNHLIHVLSAAISVALEKYVNDRIEILSSGIREENAEMKLLLQKMAKLREAVREFKL